VAKAWCKFSGVATSKTITNALPGSDQQTITGHAISAPSNIDQVQAASVRNSGGALPAGLSANTIYYIRVVDANTVTFHTSAAGAIANTSRVTISGAGSGTNTLDYITLNAGYNVAGVIQVSSAGSLKTGVYDLYFIQAFGSANYVLSGMAKSGIADRSAVVGLDYNGGSAAMQAGLVRLAIWGVEGVPNAINPLEACVVAFGIQ
jgi:predicted ATP-dependent Lon-type protease